MHVDALDDLALEPRGMHLVDIRLDLVFFPDLARGLVVKHAHQASAAGDLLDLLERNLVALTAIPAKRHFHVLPFSFRFSVRLVSWYNALLFTSILAHLKVNGYPIFKFFPVIRRLLRSGSNNSRKKNCFSRRIQIYYTHPDATNKELLI